MYHESNKIHAIFNMIGNIGGLRYLHSIRNNGQIRECGVDCVWGSCSSQNLPCRAALPRDRTKYHIYCSKIGSHDSHIYLYNTRKLGGFIVP